MARKEDFLVALDEQSKTMQGWLNEAQNEIAGHNEAIRGFKERRIVAIDAAVSMLLPNLKTEAVETLEKQLPGVLSGTDVERAIRDERITIETELKKLLARFDPKRSRFAMLTNESEARKERESFDLLKEGISAFRVPGLAELVACGYGTDRYAKHWWQLGYYSDWSAADRIVEVLKVRNWADVLQRFNELTASIEESGLRILKMEEENRALAQDTALYEKLNKDLDNVEGVVLERLRVQLKARIDSMESYPKVLEEIGGIDSQIEEHQKAVSERLHPQREKINEQLTKLQGIRASAQKSRERTVPDDYLDQVRKSNEQMRSQGNSGGFVGSYSTPVQVWRDDSFFETLFYYNLLTDHFRSHDFQPTYGNSGSSGGYMQSRDRVTEDVYGRVS